MKASPPKAVVFDLGKVLLDFDFEIAFRRLLPQVTLPLGELHSLLNQSSLLFEYETGALSTPAFFARFQAAAGYTGSLEAFGTAFGDIFREIKPMIALQIALRERGLPTYICSNTNDLAVRHIRRHFPFFRGFDGAVLSYEHGAMKPAPTIYAAVEALTGRRGAELFFLDDRPENVDAGRARGWQAVLHVSPAQSIAAVRAAGLLDDAAAEGLARS